MKALVRKDLATIKSTLLLSLVLCLAIGAYAIYEKVYLMIPPIFLLLSLIVTSTSYGYDVKADFEKFAFSMPIEKKDYVFSKLFFALAFGILGALSIFIILRIKTDMELADIFLIALLSFIACLMIAAIQLPFVLKYGAERGRLVFIISYAIIFAGLSLIRDNLISFSNISRTFTTSTLRFGLCCIGLVIIFICVHASIKIMEKKEF